MHELEDLRVRPRVEDVLNRGNLFDGPGPGSAHPKGGLLEARVVVRLLHANLQPIIEK